MRAIKSVVMGFICLAAGLAGAGTLPDAYTRVLYLESNGTQYLDTKVTATKDTRLVMRFAYTVDNAGGGGIGYGASGSAQSFRFWRSIDPTTGNAVYNVNIDDQYGDVDTYDSGAAPDTDVHVIDISNTAKSIDGHAFENTKGSLSKSIAGSLYLFGMHWGWGATYGDAMKARIYSCQIYEKQDLVRDFVPCVRKSDDVAGLYDLAKGGFYTILTNPKGDPLVVRTLDGVTVSHTHSKVFTAAGFEPELGFTDGTGTFACTAPVGEQTIADGKVKYTVVGWKLKKTDASGNITETSGEGTSCTVEVADGRAADLEWQLAPEYRVDAEANGGSVAPATQWVADGSGCAVTATPPDGQCFYRWEDANGAALGRTAKLRLLSVTEPLVLTPVFGNFVHVAITGNDETGDGSSGNPYASLAKGVTMAAAGDTVLLGTGTYTPTSKVTISKAITVRPLSGVCGDAIISGGSSRVPLALNHAEARLERIVVTSGKSDNASYAVGSAVQVSHGTMEECVVRNSTYIAYATGHPGGGGGGVSVSGSDGWLVNCIITNNTITSGNGAPCGGGLYMTAGTAVGCFISANKADKDYMIGGGAMLSGSARMINCTVVNNIGSKCGGLDVVGTSAKVVNTYLFGNVGDGNGDVFNGNAVCFDACVARYAVNDKCWAVGANSYAVGAFFTPTPANPGLDASVVVDGVLLPETDVLGNPRVVGSAADVGAIEYQASAPEVALSVSPAPAFVGDTVTYTAFASGLDGITAYEWDFDGDGTVDRTTSENSVSVQAQVAGAFAPRVTVVYAGGTFPFTADEGLQKTLPFVMYVTNGNANASWPYATRETAAPDLKTALGVAVDGQEIVMLKSKTAYKTTAQLSITKALVVHGETGNPEDVVIDAQKKGRAVMINHERAVLHSVAIANGSATDYGINLQISANGGTASNCVIRGGHVVGYWSSGAVYLTGAKAMLTHSVVTNNVTDSNAAGTDKTAGVQLNSGAKASNCLIADNHELATSGTCCTGGAYVPNGTLENCTIVRNSARKCGGVRTSSTVINCVIVGNVSDNSGASYNNIHPDQKAKYDHCACDDAEKLNDTCVRDTSANLFTGYANGDYTVAPGAVLIDAGAEVTDPPEKDLAGFTRVMNGKIDIGAYEYDTSKFSIGLKTDVSEAIVPVTVTFEATLSGADDDDVCEYAWDFDGDGTVDLTTSTNKALFVFTQGGRYSPVLTVDDTTAGKSATQDFPNLLYLMPKTIYVVKGNPSAAFPYDSFATAAKTLSTAISDALDNMEIVISNGTHDVTTQIVIDKTLDIHGYESDPAKTVLKRTGGNDSEPGYKNTRPGTFIHDLTFDGAAASRPGWYLEGYGVISNCVIRKMKNYTYWASAGAVLASGKNTLVTHCVITNNEATYLGDAGKAIVKATGGARIENCLIARNTDTAGSSIVRGGDGAYVNCTVASNSVSGSALLVTDGNLGITNCIFAANLRNGVLGQVFTCSKQMTTNCVNNLSSTPVGNWLYEPDAAKIFVDPLAKDWHLPVSSPARDRGDRRIALPATDLDGNPRKMGRVDLGCYENPVGNGTMLLVK